MKDVLAGLMLPSPSDRKKQNVRPTFDPKLWLENKIRRMGAFLLDCAVVYQKH
jgi:hypothetical protein